MLYDGVDLQGTSSYTSLRLYNQQEDLEGVLQRSLVLSGHEEYRLYDQIHRHIRVLRDFVVRAASNNNILSPSRKQQQTLIETLHALSDLMTSVTNESDSGM